MTDLSLASITRSVRRIDGALMALAAGFALVAALAPAQALESLRFTALSLVRIAPYLLIAVGLAAYLQAAAADRLIARAFRGRAAAMVVAAALFGALSPFCSCGVIPLVAALLAMGMPLPPVMAFWLSSPLMAPDMFVVTAAGLSLEFAVAKTAAAVFLGLLGGFAMASLLRLGVFEAPLRAAVGLCAGGAVRNPKPVLWAFWREPERWAVLGGTARGSVVFLGKWLTLAFFLESLMLAYLPASVVGAWVGGDSAFAVPVAGVVGAPAYLNGYAAIPTANALMQLGMTPGAALAFMVAGGVTSIPAAIAVFALVRRPVFAAYVVLGLAGAILAGYLYQLTLAWT